MKPGSGPRSPLVSRWLDRLRESLPPARADEVVAEVDALIEDRLAAEAPGPVSDEAATRALASLGSPEALAQAIDDEGIVVSGGTRRAFGRALAVVFAAHLLLSAVLTAVSPSATLLPGLVSTLPMSSPFSTAVGVAGILFLDVGLLVAAFAILGRERSHWLLLKLRAPVPGTRRDAVLSLVLLALVAAIVNLEVLRDRVFSVETETGRAGILAPDLIALIPFLDAMLGLYALRQVVRLLHRGDGIRALAIDGLAALSGTIVSALVLTRAEVVRIPQSASLTAAQATLFSDLLHRIALLVALVAGVLLLTRFVRRALRVRELIVSRR